MYALLSVIFVCLTVAAVVYMLQNQPIVFTIHHKYETINKPTQQQVKEDEDERQVYDGMTKIIQATQEFLGGEIDAESKPEAK